MQQLPKFDPEFAKKQEDAENAGEVSNTLKIVLFFVKVSKIIVAFTTLSMNDIFNL